MYSHRTITSWIWQILAKILKFLIEETWNRISNNKKTGALVFVQTLPMLQKDRDLTPSRIINASKNIRLSNQVVVAIGDNANMMQIQKVPVNSLL